MNCIAEMSSMQNSWGTIQRLDTDRESWIEGHAGLYCLADRQPRTWIDGRTSYDDQQNEIFAFVIT